MLGESLCDGNVMASEQQGSASALARWLVRRSARVLNQDRERYEEQWLADLEDRKTPLRKLWFALGVWRASVHLRRESLSALLPDALTAIESAAEWFVEFSDSPHVDLDQRVRFFEWLRQSPEHVSEMLTVMALEGKLLSVFSELSQREVDDEEHKG